MNLRIVPNIPGIPLIKKAKSHNSSSHRAIIGNQNSNPMLKGSGRVSLIAPNINRDNETGGISKPPINPALSLRPATTNVQFQPVEDVASPNPKKELVQLADGTLFNPATNKVLKNGVWEKVNPHFVPNLTDRNVEPPLMDGFEKRIINERLKEANEKPYTQRVTGSSTSSPKTPQQVAAIAQAKINKAEQYKADFAEYEVKLAQYKRELTTLAVGDLPVVPELPPKPPIEPRQEEVSPLSAEDVAKEMAEKIIHLGVGEPNIVGMRTPVKLYVPPNDPEAVRIASQVETVLKQLETLTHEIRSFINNLSSARISKPGSGIHPVETVTKGINSLLPDNYNLPSPSGFNLGPYPQGELAETAYRVTSSLPKIFKEIIKLMKVDLSLYADSKDISLENSNISAEELVTPDSITSAFSSGVFAAQVNKTLTEALKEVRGIQEFFNNNLGLIEDAFEIAASQPANHDGLTGLFDEYYSLRKLKDTLVDLLKARGAVNKVLGIKNTHGESTEAQKVLEDLLHLVGIGTEGSYDPMQKGPHKVVPTEPINIKEVPILPLKEGFYNLLERYSGPSVNTALTAGATEVGEISEALRSIMNSYRSKMDQFTKLPALQEELGTFVNKALVEFGNLDEANKIRADLESYLIPRRETANYLKNVYLELNKITEKGISQDHTLTSVISGLRQLEQQAKKVNNESLANDFEACIIMIQSLEQKAKVIQGDDWGGDPRSPLANNIWGMAEQAQNYSDTKFLEPRTLKELLPGLANELKAAGAITELPLTDIETIIRKHTEEFNNTPSAIVNGTIRGIDNNIIEALLKLSGNNNSSDGFESFISLLGKRLIPSSSQASVQAIADELVPLADSPLLSKRIQEVLPTVLEYDTKKAKVLEEVSKLLSAVEASPDNQNLHFQLQEIRSNVERALERQSSQTQKDSLLAASYERIRSIAGNMQPEVLASLAEISTSVRKVEAALDKLSERQAQAEIQAAQQSAFSLDKLTETTKAWAAGLQGVSVNSDISAEALLQLMQSNEYLKHLGIPEIKSLVESLLPNISDKQFEGLKTGLGLMNSQPAIANIVINSSLEGLNPELVGNWHQNYSEALNKAEKFLSDLQALPSEEPKAETLEESNTPVEVKQNKGFFGFFNRPSEPEIVVQPNADFAKTGSLKKAAIQLTTDYLASVEALGNAINGKFDIQSPSILNIDEKAAEITTVKPEISEFVQALRKDIMESTSLLNNGSKGLSEKLEQLNNLALEGIKANTLEELIAAANNLNTPAEAKEAIKALLSNANLSTLKLILDPKTTILTADQLETHSRKANELLQKMVSDLLPISVEAQNAKLDNPNTGKGISTRAAAAVLVPAVTEGIIGRLQPLIADLTNGQTEAVRKGLEGIGVNTNEISDSNLCEVLENLIKEIPGEKPSIISPFDNLKQKIAAQEMTEEQLKERQKERQYQLFATYTNLIVESVADEIKALKGQIGEISFLSSSRKDQLLVLIDTIAHHNAVRTSLDKLSSGTYEGADAKSSKEAAEEILRSIIEPAVASARHETHEALEADRVKRKKLEEERKLKEATILRPGGEQHPSEAKQERNRIGQITPGEAYERDTAIGKEMQENQLELLRMLSEQAGMTDKSIDPLVEPLGSLNRLIEGMESSLNAHQPINPQVKAAMGEIVKMLPSSYAEHIKTITDRAVDKRETLDEILTTDPAWKEKVNDQSKLTQELKRKVEGVKGGAEKVIVSSQERLNQNSVKTADGYVTQTQMMQPNSEISEKTVPSLIADVNAELSRLGLPGFLLSRPPDKVIAGLQEVTQALAPEELAQLDVGGKIKALKTGTLAGLAEFVKEEIDPSAITGVAQLGDNVPKIAELVEWVEILTGKNPIKLANDNHTTIEAAARKSLEETQSVLGEVSENYTEKLRYAAHVRKASGESGAEELPENTAALTNVLSKTETVLGALNRLTQGKSPLSEDKNIVDLEDPNLLRAAEAASHLREFEATETTPQINPFLDPPLKEDDTAVVAPEDLATEEERQTTGKVSQGTPISFQKRQQEAEPVIEEA